MKVVVEPGTQATDEAGVVGIVPRGSAENAEYPLTVREAARFLGVSRQTVYLWVERKQIPHLRVMGRNIRFLKSDLEPFRSRFKQEVEDGTTT
jgi:excisionase family DNA binding protein